MKRIYLVSNDEKEFKAITSIGKFKFIVNENDCRDSKISIVFNDNTVDMAMFPIDFLKDLFEYKFEAFFGMQELKISIEKFKYLLENYPNKKEIITIKIRENTYSFSIQEWHDLFSEELNSENNKIPDEAYEIPRIPDNTVNNLDPDLPSLLQTIIPIKNLERGSHDSIELSLDYNNMLIKLPISDNDNDNDNDNDYYNYSNSDNLLNMPKWKNILRRNK